ncbi:RNA polymerase sigma-70 factor (ECF subfamily) [Dysgonomonas sp. PFB1-18]|nr:RNA polymerase sigma-70 factor (ECF subfamily) [Dysgonomonas sp. PF1-14]MDH6338198.1 RNA polymerase sigma-70 factor (ECF subfamily) [Dysgonomonas sp. PF1-16]MDH6379695.1 RNA polymerase sigma-70 factor (ECF subfamily) [Dysgonomonas sp. PFB1-18]MDH6397216.1 RNA polymerase sigma-70 factor (ECF subfamily) [Dysgonomonas sp. PF1-23]
MCKKTTHLKFFSLNKKKEYSDEELLLRFKKTGESEYFHLLYERYIPLIYGLCLKYLQNPEQSQDAVIDIYENLSQRIQDYEIKIFKNWLYSVVKNHCFHILKSNKKEIIVDFDSQLMESDMDFPLFSENNDREKEDVLNQCLEKLPDPQRISIEKFFYENKSYVDIVDETGFHLKSVKSYIQNGKRNLKICIEKNLKE